MLSRFTLPLTMFLVAEGTGGDTNPIDTGLSNYLFDTTVYGADAFDLDPNTYFTLAHHGGIMTFPLLDTEVDKYFGAIFY